MTDATHIGDRTGMSGRAFALGLLVLTAVAAGLRFYALGAPSMWIDELFLVFHVAREPGVDAYLRPLAYLPTTIGLWLQGIDVAGLDPAGYHTWRAAGIDERTLRLPSAIIGIVSVPVLGGLAQRIVDRRTALIFTALVAVATWHLWVSQTGRFYVQQVLFYNICLILYYDAMTRRARGTLIVAGVFFVLAFMTQLTSPMILGVFLVDVVVRWWRGGGARPGVVEWLVWLGIAAVCGGVVWWWYDASDFSASGHSALVMAAGTVLLIGAPVAVAALCAAAWLWRRDPRLTIYLLASIGVPLAALATLGWLGATVHTRYACPAMVGWLLLAAIGVSAFYEKVRPHAGPLLAATPAVLVVVVMLFNDYAYYTGGHGFRPRWRDAFAYVQEHRRPGERVLADYIPSYQARYYLGTDQVERLRYRFTGEDLTRSAGPAWVVIQGSSPSYRGADRPVPAELALRAYFSHRILQPYSSVHVYYFDPQGAAR